MARLLINHGLGNLRWRDHWQRHLATAARKAGHVVSYVQFPAPEKPETQDWQNLLVAEAALLADVGESAGELLFVGHSLGSLNFLHAAQTGVLPVVFDRVLLVAPADPTLLPDLEIERIDPAELNLGKVAKLVQIVASDNDQWLPKGIKATFGEPLGIEPVIIPGGKHLSLADGWGYWQGVIDWVENPSADLSKR
jgi:predicted alpha/beta hydrolase family esterase